MTYNTINDIVTMHPGAAGSLLANRYRVIRQLGQGGMGSVWLAEDTQLDGKQFAIKMLPSVLVSNKRAYRQLKDEALVAMQLVHPNIVQIRAFEENNGNPFLVMDYVDGETLDDYLAEKGSAISHRVAERQRAQRNLEDGCFGRGIPEDDVLRILKPIAAALDYAHKKGVVHRDVKPGNVMIAKDGTPYILDFGIAREIQETMTRVTGKLSSGTLLYMSPEQLNGEPPKPAQDVYSFAAMAYECLKGEPPFSHGHIEFQIMNKEPETLAGVSIMLARSVMSGLAKKPEDR
ncbi:MAG: serine/threonine protein kinase, partial [Kiritimatiellae bacterium]|nr:serine/threonine protein kinase [Kiritimatiellia bacterium]